MMGADPARLEDAWAEVDRLKARLAAAENVVGAARKAHSRPEELRDALVAYDAHKKDTP